MAKSEYDNINNLRDLLVHITMHGMSTKTEDILRMQDIVGNTSVQDLVAFANDKDEMGNMKNWRRFYSLLFSIWNWEDALTFWANNSNPERAKMSALRERNKVLEKENCENKKLKAWLDKAYEKQEYYRDQYTQTLEKNMDMEKILKQKDEEIVKLKAKMYDLMVKENGAG